MILTKLNAKLINSKQTPNLNSQFTNLRTISRFSSIRNFQFSSTLKTQKLNLFSNNLHNYHTNALNTFKPTSIVSNTSSIIITKRNYWQEYKDEKTGDLFYVNSDTYERTTEKPLEYIPHTSLESPGIRFLRSDRLSDPLLSGPTSPWKIRLGWALFILGMLYLAYTIYDTKQREKQHQLLLEELEERERLKKIELKQELLKRKQTTTASS